MDKWKPTTVLLAKKAKMPYGVTFYTKREGEAFTKVYLTKIEKGDKEEPCIFEVGLEERREIVTKRRKVVHSILHVIDMSVPQKILSFFNKYKKAP